MVEKIVEETEQEDTTKEFMIPKHAVDQLFESLHIVRNKLSEVLDIPTTDTPEWDNYADQWWQQQNPDDQHLMRSAVSTLGAPVMIANMAVIKQDDEIISTRAVWDSMELSDPAFLVGDDETGQNFHIVSIPNGSMFANTLLLQLHAGAEIAKADIRFQLSSADFQVFLGIMDLYRKRKMESVLRHESLDFKGGYQDILDMMTELTETPDPRWLLPFALPVFPAALEQYTMDHVVSAVRTLTSEGILSSDGTNILLSEPGTLMAATMANKRSAVGLVSIGYDETNTLASGSTLFVRGEPLLWFMNIGEDSVDVACVDYDEAAELVLTLLQPIAAPEIVEKPSEPAAPVKQPVEAEVKPKAPFCPKCGKPATWVEAYQRWYCYNCEEYLS